MSNRVLWWILSATCVTALAGAFFLAKDDQSMGLPSPVSSASGAEGTGVESSRSRGLPTANSPPRDSGAQFKVHPFPAVLRSRSGLPMEDDPFAPSSRAEQVWLDRNGYPNAEQLMVYFQATDQALEQAASLGDVVAVVELAGRRLMQGDLSAQKTLFSAAVDGSGYALAKLAAFQGGSLEHGDPIEAYALIKLAEMRGDYKAALTRDVVVQQALDPKQRLVAEARALELYDHFVKMRRARYGPEASLVDPRPVGIKD